MGVVYVHCFSEGGDTLDFIDSNGAHQQTIVPRGDAAALH